MVGGSGPAASSVSVSGVASEVEGGAMKRYLILAVVIGLVMGAGVAIAQVGDDGVIYACARGHRGSLRLVDGPDDCGRWETSVSWNQQGIQGERGADGIDGTDGTNGVDGNLALAGQVCTENGASVIGFDDDGNIICRVGGATTTTTATTTTAPVGRDEVCNGVDDDLDGLVDENPVDVPDDGQEATFPVCTKGKWVFRIRSGYCLIEGASFKDGMANPDDSTLVCDSSADPEHWTSVGS